MDATGDSTPSAPPLDVLASPSKRRRNLILRAGTDGLLLPDDATAGTAQQQQQQQQQADSANAAKADAGKEQQKKKGGGEETVQPYTGADADVYDLIPAVPSWKGAETPLEIFIDGATGGAGDEQGRSGGGEGRGGEEEEEDAQVLWQRSTAAAEMRSPLGDGDGMFSNNHAGRQAAVRTPPPLPLSTPQWTPRRAVLSCLAHITSFRFVPFRFVSFCFVSLG